MPFSVKHLFLPDDPMIARRFQENFDNIVSELNSFPISGAFKPGSIGTTQLTDKCVTAAKLSPNLQFGQIPKVPTGVTGEPNDAAGDELCRKAFVVTAMAAFITAPATGDKGAGIATTTQHIDNSVAVSVGGTKTGIPLTGHGYLAGDIVTISDTTNYNGTYTIDSITNANQFVISKTYVAETFAASTSHVTIGFRSSTPSFEEREWFFNDLKFVYGYCKSTDLKEHGLSTAAVQTGTRGDIAFTSSDLPAKLFFSMVVPFVGSTYNTARVMVMPDYYTTTTYIYIKTSLALSCYNGFFYMVVGRDI
jgi:hypothetical protein